MGAAVAGTHEEADVNDGAVMGLVLYDSMCIAIANCNAVDEVLSVKDKARALQVYAMQVKNIEAERQACNVRLRAERRIGELLKELARADRGGDHRSADQTPNGGEIEKSPYANALADNQISTQSASRYQRLADVPTQEFESALADPVAMPSTTRLINEIRDPVPKMSAEALWLWGQLRDFERDNYASLDAHELLETMTEAMRADVRRIAPSMTDLLNAICEVTA